MRSMWYYAALISLFPCLAHAFIYEIVVLKRWNALLGKDHYVLCLSDFHDKRHPANNNQSTTLMALLAQCDRAKTKLILEDLSSPGHANRCACGPFRINSRGGILGGLARTCRSQGFTVDNVEYRYCRVSALGPILNNLDEQVHTFPSAAGITVGDLIKEINGIMHDINSHAHKNELLAGYHQQVGKEVTAQLKDLKLETSAAQSVAEYVHDNSTKSSRLELLKRLLTFDTLLLDMKLAQSALAADQFEQVIAIAGGSHMNRVSHLLQKAGYQVVYASKTQCAREYNLNRCLGSHIIDGAFCVRPEPIDLSIVERFMGRR